MWIEFENIQNVRDLGGLVTADGRRVKAGRILRGAGLADASDADIEKLRAVPLRHVVDLRDATECARRPDREVPGAEYHSLPALPGLPGHAAIVNGEPDFAPLFLKIYEEMAVAPESRDTYRALFRLLLETRDGAVYFHCTQGKDRTGVGALLVLTALGVPMAAVQEDYFLSNEGLKEAMEHPMTPGGASWSRETKENLFFVFQRNIDAYLDGLTAAWGGVDGYLRDALGLTDADFEALRREYLE